MVVVQEPTDWINCLQASEIDKWYLVYQVVCQLESGNDDLWKCSNRPLNINLAMRSIRLLHTSTL